MRKSLLLKLLLIYFIITTIITVFIILLSSNYIREHYIKTLTEVLKSHTNHTISNLKTYTDLGNDESSIQNIITKWGEEIDARITIINSDGVVIADSKTNPAEMDNHKHRKEIAIAFKKGYGESLRYSDTMKREMLYAAKLFEINNNSYVARISYFIEDIQGSINYLETRIFIVVIILLSASFVLILLLYNFIFRPLKELAKATNEISDGKFDVRLFLNTKDEVGRISQNFNTMVGRLKEQVNEIKFQNHSLHTIIENIQLPLLIVDYEGHIVFSNNNYKELAGKNDILGKYYWETTSEISLSEVIKETKQKESLVKEVEGLNRQYLCRANLIKEKGHILIILSDITDTNKLKKIKKDFVVNVSHELRTPLTVISGFVETILEESYLEGELKNHLNIIHRHTIRLINIVNDLLVLSELEDEKFKLNTEKVNIKKLIQPIIIMFQHSVKDKDIEIKSEFKDDEELIMTADSYKLEQTIINLVENAVRYTDKGHIDIKAYKNNNNIIIEIEDTGIGIPKESINRLFERFYVVDKSRSRKNNGTGLGLSIVKHIVLLHNGTINVESTIGTGTKFTLEFPII